MNTPRQAVPIFERRDDLIAWIRERLGTIPLHGIELICSPTNSASTLCFIDIDRAVVDRARDHLGGQIFGYDALALTLPIAPRFSCTQRHDGVPLLQQQCICWSR